MIRFVKQYLINITAFQILIFAVDFHAQINFTSSNLPIVMIDTHGKNIPDEPKIDAFMGIIFNDDGAYNYVFDPYNHYEGEIGIELRGSSAKGFPKKSYALETRTETGENYNISLFGMPEENDWIMHGPYSDKSLIRNILAMKLARDLGMYASRTKLIELVVNGDYKGVYVFMEKIKRDKNRVDIREMTELDNNEPAVTGGYIIKLDKYEGSELDGWNSPYKPFYGAWQNIFYQYHYPKPSVITEQQKNYIKNFITSFESVMIGVRYDYPFYGYYDWIETDSFIDYMIVNEISKNVDAYRLSTFMYKDNDERDGRVKMGPVWDFNLGFGNADYYDAWKIDGWEIDAEQDKGADLWFAPKWWKKLTEEGVFKNRLTYRWNVLRNSVLSIDYIEGIIDSLTELLLEPQKRNFQRWPVLGTYIWPNAYVGGTYENEIWYVKNWISQRVLWIDEALTDNYSFIGWSYPDELKLSADAGIEQQYSKDIFYNDIENIDSVTFVSESDELIIQNSSEYVIFKSDQLGEYIIKGIGWSENKKVELSPSYKLYVGATGISEQANPISFSLKQNYPNPFNPATTIEYSIPEKNYVKLDVYDVLGNRVALLVNELQGQGSYKVIFDGTDLSSGVYFYTIWTDNLGISKKMILIR
ncbi:CotH kinase family protein [Bacteroidota bacterium]